MPAPPNFIVQKNLDGKYVVYVLTENLGHLNFSRHKVQWSACVPVQKIGEPFKTAEAE
jgi:hypothetical protein